MTMRIVLAALAAALLFAAVPAFAQDTPALPAPVGSDVTTITSPEGDVTTIVAPEGVSPNITIPDTTVEIPVGNWIDQVTASVRDLAVAALAAALLWASRLLPEVARQFINAERIKAAEQLLGKAVDAAFNAVKGATRGKVIEVNVGSSLVAAGAQYAVDNGPGWLISWLGGPEGIKAKISARLDLGADVTTRAVMAGAPTVTEKR